jgi:hypothetical protein
MALNLSTQFTQQRINSLERQLMSRRKAINAEKDKLISVIKSRLSDPKTVMAALSLGFVAGEITYRPRIKKASDQADINSRSKSAVKRSSMENINQFLSSTYRLFTSAPVIAIISAMRSSHTH